MDMVDESDLMFSGEDDNNSEVEDDTISKEKTTFALRQKVLVYRGDLLEDAKVLDVRKDVRGHWYLVKYDSDQTEEMLEGRYLLPRTEDALRQQRENLSLAQRGQYAISESDSASDHEDIWSDAGLDGGSIMCAWCEMHPVAEEGFVRRGAACCLRCYVMLGLWSCMLGPFFFWRSLASEQMSKRRSEKYSRISEDV
eukprot:Rmarinus@m.11353